MDWIETIVNGLLVGGLYGLFGLGAAFTFGIAKIVNVAHGEFIVLAGFGMNMPFWNICTSGARKFAMSVLPMSSCAVMMPSMFVSNI